MSSQGVYLSVPPPAAPQVVAAAPFAGEDPAAADPGATDRLRAEEKLPFRESIRDSDDPEDFRAYR